MTPSGAKQRPETRPGMEGGRQAGAALGLPTQLSEVEREVLECLREAGKGLTVRQLEARILCSSDDLREALAVLLEQRVVARLNTIIPSYSYRAPSVEVHTE